VVPISVARAGGVTGGSEKWKQSFIKKTEPKNFD
jgi:hypothetical protein